MTPGPSNLNVLNAEPKRSNVLILDGGGVRGLSSLLILQALMVQINTMVAQLDPSHGNVHPHNVFQLVAGTSTGGLIALMLGKIGLTVEQCIKEYKELSGVIFGKKSFRGAISLGLYREKYSGPCLEKCVRKLLRKSGFDEDLAMEHNGDKTACAVVCREHTSTSQYSSLINKAVPICSLQCDPNLRCMVCHAARATSAAPTYFPVMKIGDRCFMDGGLEHNNPSFAIYYHYTSGERKKSTRRRHAGSTVPDFSPHPTLDCSYVRFINIGTGARCDDLIARKRDRIADLVPVPGTIKRAIFLKKALKEIAVNSQKTVDIMQEIADLRPDIFMYERFDADHGVSDIELDRYDALDEIQTKTDLYLAEQLTKDQIEKVGNEIAIDLVRLHSMQQSNDLSPSLTVDNSYLVVPTSNRGSSSGSTDHSNSSRVYLENGTTFVAKHDLPTNTASDGVAECLA